MSTTSLQQSNPNSSPPHDSADVGGIYGGLWSLPRRPPVRVTTEFDSDTGVFFHKISCKLLDSLAKLKLTFQNSSKGEVSDPQLSLTSKYLSIHYDFEEQNALLKSALNLAPGLQLRGQHDVKV